MNWNKIKKDIKAIYPEIVILVSVCTAIVVLFSTGQLIVTISPTNYQYQIDVVAVASLFVLPICFILGIIGLYLKIRKINSPIL